MLQKKAKKENQISINKPRHEIGIPKPINRVSAMQRERERNLQKLKHYLLAVRANGTCEVPGCGSRYNLQAAHIRERSTGGKDTAGNIIIACGVCHDHAKYTHGLPLEPDELIALVAGLNKEAKISGSLTGAEVVNEW